MKIILMLLLLVFVPLKIQAEEKRSFEQISYNAFLENYFNEGLISMEREKPKNSLVVKMFINMLREHNPPIDRAVHWLGENLGTFVPSGIVSLKNNGRINHKKINVNYFNEGNEKRKIEEIKRKETLLFEYKLVPIVHSSNKLGVGLVFKKTIGRINFSWENKWEDYNGKNKKTSKYYTSSILMAKFCF